MGAVVPIVAALAPVLGSVAGSLFAPDPPSAPEPAPLPEPPAAPEPIAPEAEVKDRADEVLDADAVRRRNLKRRSKAQTESGLVASLEDPAVKQATVQKKTLLGQ